MSGSFSRCALYYRDKFLGLEALFGMGVFPVDLAAREWTATLLRQAETAWEVAPSIRKPLMKTVDRQIELGRNAYAHLGRLMKDRSGRN
jgi:hypothetical protein